MDAVPISPHDSPSVVLEMIYRLKVKDVMAKDVVSVPPEAGLREIQRLLRERSITGVPVVERGRLVGIVSMQDIVEALDEGKMDESAERRMTRGLIVLEEDMPLSFAISYLNKYQYGRFPVLDRDQRLVGVVTSSDIIRALLVEMNREVQRLEDSLRESVPDIPSGTCRLEFHTVKFDFENAGKASTEIKKTLKEKQVDPAIARRAAIASYELEINQVIHAEGGTMVCEIAEHKIVITAKDSGPGIPDLEKAMSEGFSTANDWIRSLGFGAGMGLPNTKRVSDEFSIQSEPGRGTTVRVVLRH